MLSYATSIFILALASAPALAAVCRPIAKFNKEIEEQDLPDLETTFNKGQIMGEGSFGKVVKVAWPYSLRASNLVAIKRLNLDNGSIPKQVTELNKEVGVMKFIAEANNDDETQDDPKSKITRRSKYRKALAEIYDQNGIAPDFIDCLVDRKSKKAYVIMELLAGTLDTSCFHTKKSCPARQWAKKTQVERLIIYGKIANVLNNMHLSGWVHDDLKPDNIGALDLNANDVKLIDFGMSQRIGSKMHGGTDIYMDYEKLRWFLGEINERDPFEKQLLYSDPVADVFSLGIIMFQMEYAAMASRKKNVDPDCFANFKAEAGQGGSKALWFFNKVLAVVRHPESLLMMNVYLCVPSDKKNDSVCMHELMFALIHPNRAKRWTLPFFIEKLAYFITNYGKVKAVSKPSIASIEISDIESVLHLDPELVERFVI